MTANGRSSFSTTQFYFHSTLIALALVALAKERHICALQQELHDLLRSKSQAGLCSTNPSKKKSLMVTFGLRETTGSAEFPDVCSGTGVTCGVARGGRGGHRLTI